MKKRYIVLGERETHEFDITVDKTATGTIYTLEASNDSMWSLPTRGKILLSLIDTENGIKIYPKNILSENVDYSMIGYLRLLLNFERYISPTADKYPYKFIETSQLVEI